MTQNYIGGLIVVMLLLAHSAVGDIIESQAETNSSRADTSRCKSAF